MSKEQGLLHGEFERLMALNGGASADARAVLFRVFCSGAAAHDRILVAAMNSGFGPEQLAQLQDDLVAEITAVIGRSTTH